jgi:glycosyltransferase involved in cell wall biosynthesis
VKTASLTISSVSKILILIPCLNESISIPLTIKRCFENIPDAEIVVIDNASSDDTAQVAKRHGVRVINEPNQGKGFAVRRGFSEVKSHHEAILMIDGDDTYGLESFVEGLKLIGQGHDMVIGRRVKFHEDELETGGALSTRPSVRECGFFTFIQIILWNSDLRSTFWLAINESKVCKIF